MPLYAMDSEVKAARLFISYSSKDEPFADWLAERLDDAGFPVWYARWEIRVGDSIVQRIHDGLQAADFLVVVLSPAAVASPWVREELNAGLMRSIEQRGAHVLPVLIAACDIPPLLAHRKYADCRVDREKGFREIVAAILPGADKIRVELERLEAMFSAGVQHFTLAVTTGGSLFGHDSMWQGLMEINGALERAVHLCVVRELARSGGTAPRQHSFYEELSFLRTRGVDLFGHTVWGRMRKLRNVRAHPGPEDLERDWTTELNEVLRELPAVTEVFRHIIRSLDGESAA